jgi:hypothetical protein
MFLRVSERLRRVGLIVLRGSLDESSVLVAPTSRYRRRQDVHTRSGRRLAAGLRWNPLTP